MIPFTPKSKQNMTVIMMARNDGDEYGKPAVYKSRTRPYTTRMQAEGQIDQNSPDCQGVLAMEFIRDYV